jgi:3-phenylpropionate/cinnamic acid dioxygenase small subunit
MTEGSLAEVIQFLANNARALDNGDYDAWLDDFAEECRYVVQSAENIALGHDMPLIYARNKNMLRDRILSLRQANIYNIHRDRHVLGLPWLGRDDPELEVETGIAVFQTDQDGYSTLFCVGAYRDRLVRGDGALRILSREVVVDSFAVKRLLATPL